MPTDDAAIMTTTLLLRPWIPSDAPKLAALAADAAVREATGLPERPTRQEVASALDDLSGEPEVFAILLRDRLQDGPVGSIALRIGGLSGLDLDEDEGAIDYWAAAALREAGTLPEAVDAIMRHGFVDLELRSIASTLASGEGQRLTRPEWQAARSADPVEPAFVAGQQLEADALDATIPRIAYVRSGGQTGADRAALDAARAHSVPICGWCPRGGLAEDKPEAPGVLSDYPELRETASAGYVERTAANVRDSHATLVVAPAGLEPQSGTEMTVRFALSYGRPVLVVGGKEDLPQVRTWLSSLGRGITLNVAGPRESKLPGTYATTRAVVAALLDDQRVPEGQVKTSPNIKS